MTATIGRAYVIKKNSVAIAGVRTKSLSINHEPVDITTDEDDGFRTLLSVVGESSFELSVEGVLKDDVLFDVATGTGSKLLTDISIDHPEGVITGDMFLSAFESTGAYNEAVTFSATFQSSGDWLVGT
jgi:predicted secreted protein